MKKIILSIIILTLLVPQKARPQSNATTAAAVVGGLAAVGAIIATIDDMKERAELTATQWLLANHSELTSFSLKTLDFEGKKVSDLSNTSVITFKIQEFIPTDNPALDGTRYILLGFTSYGWINSQGIDFSKVNWYLVDKKEWLKMMVAYAKVSSNEKNESLLSEKISNGRILNKGIGIKKGSLKLAVPFYKLDGDMYLVTDYSSEMKLVYNERSLGFFIKNTSNLVQMRRQVLIDIHEFLYPEQEN